jgi:hypothetical protein
MNVAAMIQRTGERLAQVGNASGARPKVVRKSHAIFVKDMTQRPFSDKTFLIR